MPDVTIYLPHGKTYSEVLKPLIKEAPEFGQVNIGDSPAPLSSRELCIFTFNREFKLSSVEVLRRMVSEGKIVRVEIEGIIEGSEENQKLSFGRPKLFCLY